MAEHSITDDCRREIEALHRFFVAWFHGTAPDDDATWQRFDAVMAPDFGLVSPSGSHQERDELLSGLRALHGCRPPEQGFAIWIENYACRRVAGDVILATYEEWQRIDGIERGRLSSAVFERHAAAPHGVRWMHVHETWLPKGEASDSP